MRTILLDDYNQNIPKEQDVIGSVTTTWGHLALRNGWKIIEIYEKEGRNNAQGEILASMGGATPYNSVSYFHGGMDGLCPTLRAEKDDASVLVKDKDMAKVYRIRKLTPRECFRLMGVSDEDIDKIQAYPFHWLLKYPSYSREEKLAGMTEAEKRALMKDKVSESQQYKMAGNSIVVQVLEGIFTQMFRKDDDALF